MSEMAESKLCLKGGLSTGLESIDKLLLGLRRGEVIQLSAEPYSDSAYFALFIAKCLARGLDWAGRPINEGFSYATLFFRLTSMTHGVSRIDANGDKVIVDDAASWDVDDVFSLARKGKESNGIALIVIDALHWLCPKRDGQELRVDDVLEIVKRLRHMAEELERQLNVVYPSFTNHLFSLYPMSELEYQVSLLIKLRISPSDMANVLARDISTISSTRSRLYQKVFHRKGSSREWDDFVLSIGS